MRTALLLLPDHLGVPDDLTTHPLVALDRLLPSVSLHRLEHRRSRTQVGSRGWIEMATAPSLERNGVAATSPSAATTGIMMASSPATRCGPVAAVGGGVRETTTLDPRRSLRSPSGHLKPSARLDRNRDDRINEDEWYYDWETFRRIDRNRDGVVSQREFLGEEAAGDDDRDDRFDALDADHDGRSPAREWHGTRDAFQWLDRDSDGVLTRAEVLGDTQPTRTLFDRLDIDHNARITLNEWRWSKASFDRRDLDRNGSLERHELTAATEPRSDAYQKGAERGLVDGRQAGREDKTRRNRWDLEGQRELEQADAGYQPAMGARVRLSGRIPGSVSRRIRGNVRAASLGF